MKDCLMPYLETFHRIKQGRKQILWTPDQATDQATEPVGFILVPQDQPACKWLFHAQPLAACFACALSFAVTTFRTSLTVKGTSVEYWLTSTCGNCPCAASA